MAKYDKVKDNILNCEEFAELCRDMIDKHGGTARHTWTAGPRGPGGILWLRVTLGPHTAKYGTCSKAHVNGT